MSTTTRVKRYAAMPLAIIIAAASAPAPPAPSFDGNFSGIAGLVGLLEYTQPDRASNIVEHATLANVAGSGPVLGLTGTRTSTQATPIAVVCDTVGGALGVWQYKIFYSGLTTGTPDMTGTSAATVPLTGAALGLTLTIAAGTANTTFVSKACAATCVDFAQGINYAQATAAKAPIITKLDGRVGLETTGGRYMVSAQDLPAPPVQLVSVCRILTTPGATGILYGGDTGFLACLRVLTTGGINQYNGGTVGNDIATPAVGVTTRVEALWSNSVNDYIKGGAVKSTVPGTNTGSTNPAGGRSFGATVDGNNTVSMVHLMSMYFSSAQSQSALDAISVAAASWFAAAV